MTLLQSLILGLVQGITELLPISSSAHLVLIPEIFGWELQPTSFDITVHIATLLALVIYFRKELYKLTANSSQLTAFSNKNLRSTKYEIRSTKKLILNLIIVTIPAGLIGLLLNNFIDSHFKDIRIIVASMIVVGVIMLFIDRICIKNKKTIDNITIKDSILIGISQVFSFIRGVSRSGITIIGGMINGLKRSEAARFAFLAAIPIMTVAGLKQFFDFAKEGVGDLEVINLIVAFSSAFLSGLFVIRFLMKFLSKHSLVVFGVYRIVVGILILLIL